MAAGIAAIKDNDYYMNNCKVIMENREYTASALEKMGFTVLPSKANFIFAESGDIYCLNEICLTLRIIAVNDVDSRTGIECDLFHVAELFQLNFGNIHGSSPFR